MKKIVTISNLKHRYNHEIVLDIPALEIREGEVFTMMGPNGSGKSTLLKILGLLLRPTEGETAFRGERVNFGKNNLQLRRQITMVFQETLLFNTTVEENVAAGLRFCHRPKMEIKRIVEKWLDGLKIGHLKSRHASTLSGGEARRVSLARALALEPTMLLLDEPFGNLDPIIKEELIEDLRALLRNTNITTVFVTQDREEALALSDRMAVIEKGRILQVGTPQEIFNYPINEAVAAMVGVETVISGRVVRQEEGLVFIEVAEDRIIEAGFPLPQSIATAGLPLLRSNAMGSGEGNKGKEVLVCIRPEEVTILGEGIGFRPSSARNRFRGRVERIAPWGMHYKITLDCGFPLVAFLTKQSAQELSLSEGQFVTATFKATGVHVIRISKK